MFQFKSSKITWEEVSNWSVADYDFSYVCRYKHQPITSKQGLTTSVSINNGKPYWLNAYYFVKCGELLICYKNDQDILLEALIIRLNEISLFTKIVTIESKSNFFFSSCSRKIISEQFFSSKETHFNGKETLPNVRAFQIRLPDKLTEYCWNDASTFIDNLKKRIFEIASE